MQCLSKKLSMKKISIIAVLITLLLVFQNCNKNDATSNNITTPNLPSNTLNYIINYPKHIKDSLDKNDNTPNDNPITNDGATLGRVLFYDKNLSKNNSVSCGSCHKQNQSFDDDAALSKGFDGGSTARNSMAILNLRFYKSGKMFWDERSETLEKQVLQPIQNHVEMGLTLAELETKVAAQTYYPALFQKAFGSTQIDSIKIAKALAQFCRSIVTYQSKYDLVKQGLATFTAQEQQGEQIFLNVGVNTCASCHTPPMFITSSPKAPFTLADATDFGINNEKRFKSGSLRNIGIRSSLFHNGSVSNLQTMLTPSPTSNPIPAHTVAPQDVSALLAFLNTLTDNTILTEERFSTPFK